MVTSDEIEDLPGHVREPRSADLRRADPDLQRVDEDADADVVQAG